MQYQSKWKYPDSDVYRNKLGITDLATLNEAEKELTGIRQLELIKQPITDGNWDLKHLQKIHKYIFQDVYEFAGQIRQEQISKGYTKFANPMFIEPVAEDLFRELKNEKYLKGLNKEAFCDRLAYYMGEMNMIHPFYEGNGRTIREFSRTLAMSNGYTLEWERLDKNQLMNASINSIVDHKPLAKVLEQAVLENEPSKQVMKEWQRLSENELEL